MVRLNSFCVEKNLSSWASSRVIARGRDYYRKGSVLTLNCPEEGHFIAEVEGSQGEPYRVEIRFDDLGKPFSQCSCPFKWEPLCKHAVAVLIAWQQQETGSEPILGALPEGEVLTSSDPDERNRYIEELVQLEREERRNRSKEQDLRIIERPKEGPIGVWRISSANPALKGESYRVTVRDAHWRHAGCSCLDYLKNELGTCKHIELVKRRLETKRARAGLAALASQDPCLHIYLASRQTHNKLYHPIENLRFYGSDAVQGKVGPILSEFLDKDSYLLNGASDSQKRFNLERLINRLSSSLGGKANILVDPLVWETLKKQEEQARWEEIMEQKAGAPAQGSIWKQPSRLLKVLLHPYQKEGILFACKKRQAFLGDDMGLGKTIQAIGSAVLFKEMGQVKRALVIAPASLKFQWKREIEKACHETSLIVSGTAKDRLELYKRAREFFVILNYELLYYDFKSIASLGFDFVILDEAQRIKNWDTKIAQAVKKLQAPFKLVLTGTPLQNRLPELQSISEFLNPRALGAPWKLIPTYAHLDQEGKIRGYTNLDHLRSRLQGFFLRRTKAEVLKQLPKRTDKNFWTPILARQQEVHDELACQIARIIDKWKKFGRLTKEDVRRMLRLLNGMRMVANAYGQYDWKPIESEVMTTRVLTPRLKKRIESPKLEEFAKVMADLLETPDQKIIVFCQWERLLHLAELYIRELLIETKSKSILFCGSLSLKKRDAAIRCFHEDPQTRVFFSTDAGGLGLNLQQAASCLVNLEVPWNPAVLEQRVGRILRLGQKRPVCVINFISSECIEERIFGLVANKKALFSGLFDQGMKEIRFKATQAASFVEKMEMIIPEETTQKAAQEQAAVAELSHGEDKIKAISDEIAPGAHRANAQESPAPRPSPAPLKIPLKFSQDQEGVHFTLPQETWDALKTLGPFFKSLATLIS